MLDGGPLFAPYVKVKGGSMIASEFDPSFSLALAAKDARLVAAAAESAGLDLPLPRVIAEQMGRGVDAGPRRGGHVGDGPHRARRFGVALSPGCRAR